MNTIGTRFKIKKLRVIVVDPREKIGEFKLNIKSSEFILNYFQPVNTFNEIFIVGKLEKENDKLSTH